MDKSELLKLAILAQSAGNDCFADQRWIDAAEWYHIAGKLCEVANSKGDEDGT